MMVNQPHPNDEVVKCVVVGDSGVGKTCLVCAWACNAQYDLKKLVKTHVATVWAIDHYQRDIEVLERSWCEVDGVRVSLRLWDTFGYHDKDRRFAYRGADVVLLCFSTVRPSSLRNVKTIWYPEIRRFCPTTPIILAGTQTDLRYLYNDDDYLKLEKGLMYKDIHEADIVTPAMGHEVAKDIGAPFYESSVLTKFGVSDIFINSVRAALIERRKLKFWNTQLRRVQRPLIQQPVVIPTPALPSIIIAPPSPQPGLPAMLYDQSECDVTFVLRGVCLEAHRVILAVSCQVFEDLFSCEEFSKVPARLRQQPSHIETLRDAFRTQSVTSEDECLLDNDVNGQAASPETGAAMLVTSTASLSPTHSPPAVYPLTIFYNHPAIEAVEVKNLVDPFTTERTELRTFITLHPDITVRACQLVLEFLYSGNVCQITDAGSVREVRRAAELLGLNDLLLGLNSLLTGELYLCAEVEKQVSDTKQARLRTLALSEDGFLTDVLFEVDDGQVAAHKVLLMAGCEMMYAMFSNHFLESSADVVSFSGVNCDTFRALMEYIYTGEVTSLGSADCMSLIVTANRLCLPRLVNLAEAYIVSELQRTDRKVPDCVEEAALLLEPCELHNANQLTRWCERFLSIHYRELTQMFGKLFRSLPKENQDAIEKKRWPPVWHLKEMERYERQTHDRFSYPAQRQRQDYNRCFSGCLCFSRRARHRLNDPVDLPM